MSIQITEIHNDKIPQFRAIEEKMQLYIPDIPDGIPNRNGFIWALCGSGGSGKTSLLLNFFKSDRLYKGKFHNIFYIVPESSFLSVKDHPFEKHDQSKIYHEMTPETLDDIYQKLCDIKQENTDGECEDWQYNLCVIDDFADKCKDVDVLKILNKMLIKARHLSCAFIFTLQSFLYLEKILRKQITNYTIFKPRNAEEWASLTKEMLHLNKDDGLILYDYVFGDEPYNHLDVDTRTDTLYKNFNLLKINK